MLETLRQLEALELAGLQKEIIYVDDGSHDGSQEVLAGIMHRCKVYTHEKNTGVGAAMRTGIANATGDIIVRQDVDLEYSVNNIPLLIAPILNKEAHIVYGSRTIRGHRSHTGFYDIGTRAVNTLFNALFLNTIYNFTSAAKAWHSDVFKNIQLKENGFETESEVSAKAIRLGYTIQNVPIAYKARTFAQGKKMRWYYAFRIITSLVKYRFKRLD